MNDRKSADEMYVTVWFPHATLLLVAGEHIKIVSERLGHSTTRLTLDTYSHVLEGMQQKTSAKLEDMLYKTGT